VRRYLPTFILLFFLLLVGGLAVTNAFGNPSITPGPYVPTLSADPQTGQLQALIFALAVGGIVVTTLGMGLVLAITFYRLTLLIAHHPAISAPPPKSAAPKSNTGDQGLAIPLTSNRSLAIFWVAVVLIVVGFQSLRYLGQPPSVAPFGYIPSLESLSTIVLFRLPGSHINGLPAFIAGPGDNLLAIHAFIGVLGLAVVGVAAMGLGLAQGFARLDTTVRQADKYKNTPVDRIIPAVEQRLEALRAPRPKRLPGNPIDGFLIGLNVLLFLVIAGIVAFYVLPSYSGVAAVDNAIEATRIAAIQPPTPTAGPGAPTPAEIMQADFDKLPAGAAGAGELVFQGTGGCSACHSLEPDVRLVGPSQAGLSQRAPTRKPGYSAEAYLYESIVNPNAFVVDTFQPDLMPKDYLTRLTAQQLADVIAFLLTK